jgi:hypothetical protein
MVREYTMVPAAFKTSTSYVNVAFVNRPTEFSNVSVGRNESTTVLLLGVSPVGDVAFTLEPSGFANEVSNISALGETGVCCVPEQPAAATIKATIQLHKVFLCIKPILLNFWIARRAERLRLRNR